MERNTRTREEYTLDAARAVIGHIDRAAGPCAVVTGDGRLFVLESSDVEALHIARLLMSAADECLRVIGRGQ